jgi:hypothetical protein|tara:strand:- start:452 stop:856 length:405 start_codon:yes stop_codon:yes gene_type:complete
MTTINIGKKLISPLKRVYDRKRGKRLWERGVYFSGIEGLENVCQYSFSSSLIRLLEGRQKKLNPLILDVYENWEKHGFKDKEESILYLSWMIMLSLKEGEQIGYNGDNSIEIPEKAFEEYPLWEFREIHASRHY